MMVTWGLPCLLSLTLQFRLMSQKQWSMDKLLQSLLSFLKEVVCTINSFFGVTYIWVSLANPGQVPSQIEVGLGECIGVVGFVSEPGSGLAGVAIGVSLESFIGSDIYNLAIERSDQGNLTRTMGHQFNPNQPVYIFYGNIDGGLQNEYEAPWVI